MTYDLRNEISHIKSYLLRARNTPESILKIELRLNRLRLDVWRAGNLSGIDITDDIPESYLEIRLQCNTFISRRRRRIRIKINANASASASKLILIT